MWTQVEKEETKREKERVKRFIVSQARWPGTW